MKYDFDDSEFLTNTEVRLLFTQYHNGDISFSTLGNKLLNTHLRTIKLHVHRILPPEHDDILYEEAFHTAMEYYLHSIEKFDLSIGVKFNTFLYNVLNTNMQSFKYATICNTKLSSPTMFKRDLAMYKQLISSGEDDYAAKYLATFSAKAQRDLKLYVNERSFSLNNDSLVDG